MLHLGRIAQWQFAFDIVEEDVHTKAFRQHAQLHTDMAIANDTELFTTRFK